MSNPKDSAGSPFYGNPKHSSIPYFFPKTNLESKFNKHFSEEINAILSRPISKQELEDALAGRVRFDANKFKEVVMSCPGIINPIVPVKVIQAVMAVAACSDGSIDVLKCGRVMGELVNISECDPDVIRISKWINDTVRLPPYKKKEG